MDKFMHAVGVILVGSAYLTVWFFLCAIILAAALRVGNFILSSWGF